MVESLAAKMARVGLENGAALKPEAPSRADIERQLLDLLENATEMTHIDISGASPQEIRGVLSSLAARQVVEFEQVTREMWELTEEGEAVARDGSPEARAFAAVPEGTGATVAELETALGAATARIALGQAFKRKWLAKRGDRVERVVAQITDNVQLDLTAVCRNAFPEKELAKTAEELKKRKLVQKRKLESYRAKRGAAFTRHPAQLATDLTADMLANGSWRTAEFKAYNLAADGIAGGGGHLHPLMKVRAEFRRIFFEMGFTEMPTNRFVESSFWNFDALFQPQQHPARDMHDTFFLKSPATCDRLPGDYVERVRRVHSEGGYGSVGYKYDWKIDEAQKLLLRTHTTAISSRMLYAHARAFLERGGRAEDWVPAKLFSIDRVFRNETVDATHLAEFHQVEGVIADRGICLGDLIGFLYAFFRKMGVENLRFKPAYNPYTEPSLEIFSFHEGLGKWVEIGNSGMFRPEMLRPFGLPDDVQVLGWGLSLERPTMIKYGIDNIRELLGHKVDLDMVRRNPICRLDKKMGREV